jgi:endonuclease/exonuclease/phosphatase (EEP) superfamily protein YafD
VFAMKILATLRRSFILVTSLAGVCLALASLLPFAGRLHWRIDLFSHFRFQYFWGLAVLVIVFLILKNRRLAAAAFVFALLNASLITPLYLPTDQGLHSSPGKTYRLLIANVNTGNRSYSLYRDLVQEVDPDFILLVEIDQAWVDALTLENLGYAHNIVGPQSNNFGIGLFSRHPLDSYEIMTDEHDSATGLLAGLTLDERHLQIIGVHPPPPVSAAAADRRNMQIASYFQLSTRLSAPLILAGDFNTTTWSSFLSGPLEASGLRDSRAGFGLQPTWPTFWPAFLHIPIDHAFVSQDVRILDRMVGPPIGSDHLPLWLDFSLDGPN